VGKVVVGLGNPGAEYDRTRHNVGFLVVDLLAKRWGAALERSRFFEGHAGDARRGEERVRLAKPMTYMNLSGPAYRRVLDVYEAKPEEALVVVDDFMVPFATIRLRPEGSAGGHNGLKSVEQAIGSQRYPRLRIGIGPVPSGRDAADFVLTRWNAVERKELPFLLEAAADAVEAWLDHGIERAMERHNRGPGKGGEVAPPGGP
jgi:PTH1 family peptidyl-tRNA hydrolase